MRRTPVMRYPTREYQSDPPSALLLRRPQEIDRLMSADTTIER